MEIALIIILIVFSIVNLLVIIFKKPKQSNDIAEKIITEISHNSEKSSAQITENLSERISDKLGSEFSKARTETAQNSRESRAELTEMFTKLEDRIRREQAELRKTVDEELKTSVEQRFNESFKLIGERLEQVHIGLGEMKNLARETGDLKQIFTQVKLRGNIGEIQLETLLAQILAPAQYEKQKRLTKDSLEAVDFVIKLPEKGADGAELLLPVDSKFPMGNFRDDNADDKNFFKFIENSAKSINQKYIKPPITTDFAILFLPGEGLYAKLLSRPEFFDKIREELRVLIIGPVNFSAFLSSLQMGFRTLAIEKRSAEVWNILGNVKSEFGKFAEKIEKMKAKIDAAAKEADGIDTRTRAIVRQLKSVDENTDEAMPELMSI
ncbi:MAG: DNA recombination protein RmuC [Ruminococcus sp.]|jgi:DNA recombination protein RmuC|nr:DNA recombination protein RmuC [Ruminococcus sp.]